MDAQTSRVSFRLDRKDGFCLDVDFTFPNTGITVLFGVSGSGKTTVLRCVAGLEKAQGCVRVEGSIWQDDSAGIFIPTWQRRLGYVFQEASLFPHLSARQNVEYAAQRSKSKDARQRLEEAIELLGIQKLMDRKPAELSGGERQRVGIARALATQPQIMLFDEPLAALDFKRKEEILPWLIKLKQRLQIPMLYVTHSAEEVMRLADHIIVLEDGKIKTSGPLQEVLSNVDLPIKIGEDTGVLLKGKVKEVRDEWGMALVECGALSLYIPRDAHKPEEAVSLRIFARDVTIALEKPNAISVQNCLEGVVTAMHENAEEGGSYVQINCSGELIVAKITKKAAEELAVRYGSKVWVLIKSASMLSV